jgi:Zn-dependent protease with chaperone function
MEEDKLAALIRPLEDFAVRNPALYRFRVALLAALGYLYLLLIVSILLTIVGLVLFYGRISVLTIKLIWIPIVLAGLVLRSLWITVPVPDGTELEREQAPALFDLVHEVTVALKGPKVHHILISGEFNASIVQIPKFGMFGWLTNYLVIGLPLLRALNPEEFRAVLAHEVGHLSAKHGGGFTSFIYRLRQSWFEILQRVHQERRYASFLFEPFLNWYAPYLNAYSFVLARARERQADTYAIELAGKEVTAVTLARMEAKQRVLDDDFWPGFFRQAREEAKAPRDPFVQMLRGLNQPIGPINAQKYFFQSLSVPTGYHDTHPALSDRLAAIGFAKDSPELAALLDALIASDQKNESAADHYLRELPDDFLGRLNRMLREELVQTWNESHAQANEAKRKLSKLEEQANNGALTLEEQWERATLVNEIGEQKDTLPLLTEILRADPKHVNANFAMGLVLLEQQNPEGIGYLEKAMDLSPPTTGHASLLLSGFYFEQGDKELAESYRKRADEHFEKEQKLQELAFDFTAKDKFVPHELSEAVVKQIQEELSKVRGLAGAYLVRKLVDGMDPFYVLGVHASHTWREGRNDLHIEALFEELSAIAVLPQPMIFLSLDGEHHFLSGKISRVAGSAIHVRSN